MWFSKYLVAAIIAVLADDLISEHNIDIFGVTETRVCQYEFLSNIEASPPSYIITHTDRPNS